MTLTKKLKKSIAVGALALATLFPSIASASDIFIGLRAPTPLQEDARIGWSRNEKGIDTLTGALFTKYFTGDESGLFAFANLPYKLVNSPKGLNNGLGDLSLGLGPRGRINTFHWISYLSLIFPSGELGNGRYDTKAGLFATYHTPAKSFEIDASLDYNFTGIKDNINPPNEISGGLLAGGRITDKFRLAGGLTAFAKDNGDLLLNPRIAARYTFSPSFHTELLADGSVYSRNLPKAVNITFLGRYNF